MRLSTMTAALARNGWHENMSAQARLPWIEMAMWLSAMRTKPWVSEMHGGAILWSPVRSRARSRKRAMSPGAQVTPAPLAMRWYPWGGLIPFRHGRHLLSRR